MTYSLISIYQKKKILGVSKVLIATIKVAKTITTMLKMNTEFIEIVMKFQYNSQWDKRINDRTIGPI